MQEMQVTKTRGGIRLQQHGVVVSELRATAGPTHSVFDVLAALTVEMAGPGHIGLLGFSAGGMMAPLVALGWEHRLWAVDWDREAYGVFCRHCPQWVSRVMFHEAEASAWLRRRRRQFGLLVEDLSVATAGDVVKPAESWQSLPELIRGRLASHGVSVHNLLPDPVVPWTKLLPLVRRHFQEAHEIRFDEFENRLLVTGEHLPSARDLAGQLGRALRRLGSRQAGRIRVGHA